MASHEDDLTSGVSSINPEEYRFAPEEKPQFPGSPYMPSHPNWRRAAYACVGLLVGTCSTFDNALVNVNIGDISGSLGLYVAQASWLPAIYTAMNASGNLTLVKARAQFGIPNITHGLLIVYALTTLVQLATPSFVSEILVRAANGITAAALITLGVYYLLQVFSPKHRAYAIVIGIALPQLGTPLARLVPIELLSAGNWRGLDLVELGIALVLLTVCLTFPLPPSERSKAFEPLDLVTIGLFVPAMLLLCGVLAVGRVVWWTDTPWLGWVLAATVPLFATALLIEIQRAHPLILFSWLGSVGMLRFGAVVLLVRFALAEQTYGAVGFLTAGGLTNDQLHTLFAIVAVAMLAGMLTAALTLSERSVHWQVMIAALIIALGAWIDTNSNNLTRPPQLYLSQALLGFGTTLFIGPALAFGIVRILNRGIDYLVSFLVLFSSIQNVGGLLGSAVLGTYEIIQARAHAVTLTDNLLASNPDVVARIDLGAGSISGVVTDPAQRTVESAGLLAQAMTREANVLAFNDVFRIVSILALMCAAYVGCIILFNAIRQQQKVSSESGA